MTISIQAHWDLFNAIVLSHDLPAPARNVMKMAFYAGVLTMMDINYKLGGDDFTEDQACKVLDSIHRECREYVQRIKEEMS